MKFVKIPNTNYEMGIYPVTQGEWQEVMGNNPSYFQYNSQYQKTKVGKALFKDSTINRPVEQVSWNDCQEFIKKLNDSQNKYIYRLPTGEEWEYCARAESTTYYFFGNNTNDLGKYVWYSENSNNQTHDVGQKLPNPFGLYDILGNVWEWTSTAGGNNSGVRGGSWHYDAVLLHSGFRSYWGPGNHGSCVGFRLARTKL